MKSMRGDRYWLRVSLILLSLFAFILYCEFLFSDTFRDVGPRPEAKAGDIYHVLDYRFGDMSFSNGDRNESGYEEMIVPDIVHYLLLDKAFNFDLLISTLSVLRHHRPGVLMLHTNLVSLTGRYWHELIQRNAIFNQQSDKKTIIQVIPIKRPEHVFGKKFSQIWHAADVVRLNLLRKYGGIFFDTDVYVAQSLHHYRHFEMTLNWDEGQFLGCQIIIAHRNARFLKLWIDSYHEYDGSKWYYNAGELPTTRYLQKDASLIHRVKRIFGTDTSLVGMLYTQRDSQWQHKFETIHLLIRHRSYMVNTQPDYVDKFDERNIRTYNRTFGEMARLVYYNTTELLSN